MLLSMNGINFISPLTPVVIPFYLNRNVLETPLMTIKRFSIDLFFFVVGFDTTYGSKIAALAHCHLNCNLCFSPYSVMLVLWHLIEMSWMSTVFYFFASSLLFLLRHCSQCATERQHNRKSAFAKSEHKPRSDWTKCGVYVCVFMLTWKWK